MFWGRIGTGSSGAASWQYYWCEAAALGHMLGTTIVTLSLEAHTMWEGNYSRHGMNITPPRFWDRRQFSDGTIISSNNKLHISLCTPLLRLLSYCSFHYQSFFLNEKFQGGNLCSRSRAHTFTSRVQFPSLRSGTTSHSHHLSGQSRKYYIYLQLSPCDHPLKTFIADDPPTPQVHIHSHAFRK
jgi:hypothetical protein